MTQGYYVTRCLNCGEDVPGTKEVKEKRDPNAHDFTYSQATLFPLGDEDVTSEGSKCTSPYFIVDRCKCGAYDYNDVISGPMYPALGGHEFDPDGEKIIIAPTCQDGLASYPCKNCDEVLECPVIKVTDCVPSVEKILISPTCTKEGKKVFLCSTCGNEARKPTTMKPLGKDAEDSVHTWSGGSVVKEATVTATGLMRYVCTAECGAVRDEVIPLLPSEKSLIKNEDGSLNTGVLIMIIAGGLLVVGGTLITLYFTLFKKKRASDSYKYKFNTLGKK
jgi:hypothetical protein